MNRTQTQYYRDMMARERGVLIVRDEHLCGVVTFFVGDDDEKYMTGHVPWTIVDDDPMGETLYIDQFIAHKGNSMGRHIHQEFEEGLKELKIKFPNITTVKWVRVGAQFRKHGKIEGVTHGRRIHSKNIKF
jgi:hypothetical protein